MLGPFFAKTLAAPGWVANAASVFAQCH